MENEIEEYREKDIERNGKECIQVLKHIYLLNGDYNHYIRHVNEDYIDHVKTCCEMFLVGY